jgi:hypothetical protein
MLNLVPNYRYLSLTQHSPMSAHSLEQWAGADHDLKVMKGRVKKVFQAL